MCLMRSGPVALAPLLIAALGIGGCAGRLPAPATAAGDATPATAAVEQPAPAAGSPAPAPAARDPLAELQAFIDDLQRLLDALEPPPGDLQAFVDHQQVLLDGGGRQPGAAAEAEPRFASRAEARAAAREAMAQGRAEAEVAGQPRPSLRELCRRYAPELEPKLDATRRVLHETICGANLWLDTLLGGDLNVENARRVAGRIELSSIYTEADGYSPKARLRLNYDLPTLKHRFNLFLGRENAEEAIEDRREPFAVRSSVFGIEADDQWLTGLGYSPPGRYADKFDFRLGLKIQSETKVYVQGRYRKNFFLGDVSVLRFRETVFWENREAKFGSTTSFDFDRVVRPDFLIRWGNVGTISGKVEGLAWRSSLLGYKNLPGSGAFSTELFVRGESKADVPLREYGVRGIYRFSFLRRWLFGELILGYSYPREELEDPREGSALVGFGIDLWFGEDPW